MFDYAKLNWCLWSYHPMELPLDDGDLEIGRLSSGTLWNTLVLKPTQACPLTKLKWAELVAKAGFPPGVVNVVPGKGSECGQAILDHPGIKKVGFTGSTPTGKKVMESCGEMSPGRPC